MAYMTPVLVIAAPVHLFETPNVAGVVKPLISIDE